MLAGISLETLKQKGWAKLNYPSPYLPFENTFPTESGKFEFVSKRAASDGHGKLPHFELPESSKSTPGALKLISSANKRLLNSVYGQRPRHQDAAIVSMHPQDLADRKIVSGSRVRIWNENGEFVAVAETSSHVRRGVVHTAKGLWPKFNGGSNVNATVPEQDADMGQGAIFKDNQVWIEPIN